MKKLALLTAVVASTLGFAAPAFADNYHVYNALGGDIHALYISPSGADHWGNNVISEPCPDGGNVEFGFQEDDGNCEYDFRIENAAGNAWVVHGIDLCKIKDIAFGHNDAGEVAFITR